jgi:hypothetical protein
MLVIATILLRSPRFFYLFQAISGTDLDTVRISSILNGLRDLQEIAPSLDYASFGPDYGSITECAAVNRSAKATISRCSFKW